MLATPNNTAGSSTTTIFQIKYLLLLLPSIYIFGVTTFLNQTIVSGVLFPSPNLSPEFISFSSDIFDIFWLIIAAIPNGIFAVTFFQKLKPFAGSTGSAGSAGSEKLKKSIKSILYIFSPLLLGAIIYIMSIYPTTRKFNNHENVWSYSLSSQALMTYYFLEYVSVVIICIETMCVITYIYRSMKSKTKYEPNLSSRSLSASIILFLYWIMLGLSDILNMKISKGTVKRPDIMSLGYSILGSTVTLAITASAYLFIRNKPQQSKNSFLNKDRQFIIGSIIIPGIPIILQILQLVN